MRGLILAVLLLGSVPVDPPADLKPRPPTSPIPPGTPPPVSVTEINGQPATPVEPQFVHGEKIVYSAEWMGISMGEATSTVETGATFNGKPAIHLKATAKSGKAFSIFFSIRDASESWVDPVGLYSLGYVSDQKEGNWRDKQIWTLDDGHGVAHVERIHRKDDGWEDYLEDKPVPLMHLQDPFSIVYYYRAFPLKVGDVLTADVITGGDMWKLKVEVLEKEGVVTPAGTYNCLKVHPEVTRNGEPDKRGKMYVWITDDKRHIPVKVQTSTPFGNVSAVLERYEAGVTSVPASVGVPPPVGLPSGGPSAPPTPPGAPAAATASPAAAAAASPAAADTASK